MSRPDVIDKDPFANTEDVPRDNVSSAGFLTRFILRFGFYRLLWILVSAIFAKLIYDKYPSSFSIDSLLDKVM